VDSLPAARNGGAILLALVLAVVIGWDIYKSQGDPPSDGPSVTLTQPGQSSPAPDDPSSPGPIGLEPSLTP
jgi:hypothetical protein